MVKISIYRTLECSQKLAIIQGALIQEQWLNLSKNIKLRGFFNGHIVSLLSKLLYSLKANNLKAKVVMTRLPPCLWPPCGPIPRNLSLSDLSGSSLENQLAGKTPFTGLAFIWPDLERRHHEHIFPQGICRKKKKKTVDNCLASKFPEAMIPVGVNKKLTKTLKKRKLGMRCPQGIMTSSDIPLGI